MTLLAVLPVFDHFKQESRFFRFISYCYFLRGASQVRAFTTD
ncbi:hypothetical protein XIS1_480107 [Xenorhabdus innexi]|uniref:Uncharacterized protein n=1 Tax=Xenorhabdus innexi TaxID=290109 RepID=A0A1N6MYT7_9GAMM|nr:hypothetical protein XIS1_480107 [Xenorhabdus innexi]